MNTGKQTDAKRPWQNDPVTCVTWKSGGVTDAERIANLQFSLRNEVDAHVKAIKRGDSLKAHADKLAEALSLAQATIERLRLKYDLGSVWGTLDVAKAALAAYESEEVRP